MLLGGGLGRVVGSAASALGLGGLKWGHAFSLLAGLAAVAKEGIPEPISTIRAAKISARMTVVDTAVF